MCLQWWNLAKPIWATPSGGALTWQTAGARPPPLSSRHDFNHCHIVTCPPSQQLLPTAWGGGCMGLAGEAVNVRPLMKWLECCWRNHTFTHKDVVLPTTNLTPNYGPSPPSCLWFTCSIEVVCVARAVTQHVWYQHLWFLVWILWLVE